MRQPRARRRDGSFHGDPPASCDRTSPTEAPLRNASSHASRGGATVAPPRRSDTLEPRDPTLYFVSQLRTELQASRVGRWLLADYHEGTCRASAEPARQPPALCAPMALWNVASLLLLSMRWGSRVVDRSHGRRRRTGARIRALIGSELTDSLGDAATVPIGRCRVIGFSRSDHPAQRSGVIAIDGQPSARLSSRRSPRRHSDRVRRTFGPDQRGLAGRPSRSDSA